MAPPPESSCRIYAILARDGRSAVVFRRGPSKQVLVLRWWLDDDSIEEGQWLKGRIYERRCDVSPNGDLLIYFAANWKGPFDTWTAVSRTPYLTALALWAKGDAWGGGGVFEDASTIGLNHFTADAPRRGSPRSEHEPWHPLGPDFSEVLPAKYKLRRWSEHAGFGEDGPLEYHRLTRDGWTMIAKGDKVPHHRSGYSWLYNSPEIYERSCPKSGLVLRRLLKAIGERNGPWYVEDFEILTADGRSLRMIASCSWADWQANGDLLFALGGCLYRLDKRHVGETATDPLDNTLLVADLAQMRFRSVIAPEWARQWP